MDFPIPEMTGHPRDGLAISEMESPIPEMKDGMGRFIPEMAYHPLDGAIHLRDG